MRIPMFIFIALSLVIGIFGCAKEQKVGAPKEERIEKSLVPSKAEAKG